MKKVLKRIGIGLLCALGLYIIIALAVAGIETINDKKAKKDLSSESDFQTEEQQEYVFREDDAQQSEINTPVNNKPAQSEWIKIICPLCDGGKNLTVCPVCKGDGKITTLSDNHNCYNCSAFEKGYLTCPLCDNDFYIIMKNYETDSSVPTPQKLAAEIKAIGNEPLIQSLCTHCNGGTELQKCPACKGSGYENSFSGGTMFRYKCSECDKGYIKCDYCDDGRVHNDNYKAEKAEWKVRRDNILNGIVNKEKSGDQQAFEEAKAQAMQQANEMINNDYNAAVNSGGSGGSSASGICKHCFGTGLCSMCNGDGRMKNSYVGGEQKCSSCGGSGLCPYCH